MKRFIKIISLISAATMMLCVFAGCGDETGVKKPSVPGGNNNEFVVEGAGKDEYAKYDTEGKVKIAVDTARPTDYQALFDAFSDVYPNIELDIQYFAHTTEDSAQEYLTAKASTGDLPDIVFDEAGPMTLYISQGWVHPLTEYVKDDPTFNNIPQNLINDYTFGGELYALPLQATFGGLYLNPEIFEKLNLDLPEYDWTPDDFLNLVKSTTTSEYSALASLSQVDYWMAATMGKTCTLQGYDYGTKRFSMQNSAVKALEYCANIIKLPGAVATTLKNSTSGKSDYEIKFGAGDAWENGKIAFAVTTGTWDSTQKKYETSEFYPCPQDASTPGRINLHVDHCFMTTAVANENKEAAFQVLRYITYSTEGNLARLSMYTEENEGAYSLINDKYYPIVTTPEVIEKFKELPSVKEVDIYLIENIKNGYRADPWKIVPDWYKLRDNYLKDGSNNVINGTADASATCKSMENKVNAAMSDAWASFESKLAQVQQEFNSKNG